MFTTYQQVINNMSTAILICAGISVLLLIFELVQIVAALSNIRETLDIIHRDLCSDANVFKNKPLKQREYWRDQNGFKHWRKKDA